MAQVDASRQTSPRPRPDPNLGVLLREPFLAFSAQVLARLRAAGHTDLRAAHLVVFQHIDPRGSRITDLAAKAQMTKPSMGYLVDHLERCGYLRRTADPADGRARIVELTDRGWREVDDALEIIADMERELAASMGDDKLATLRRLLTELHDATGRWADA
ncbi:MAG TPA: MarR family winged helix-turn-helix transcriptional regulator [Acidimicrobiales bacterium]